MKDQEMIIHERVSIVEKANCDIALAALKIRDAAELTDIEYLGILTNMIQTTLKYMLRFERHGDENTPSGIK